MYRPKFHITTKSFLQNSMLTFYNKEYHIFFLTPDRLRETNYHAWGHVRSKDLINLEIRALQKLKKSINSSFNNAVIQISRCQSKVVLCGVGKSGLIASKIAATLASVGTPSFSISANEASHGDLGMLSKKDILITASLRVSTREKNSSVVFAFTSVPQKDKSLTFVNLLNLFEYHGSSKIA